MIPVRVHGVGMSPYNQGFVALLMDDTYNKWLPIYIGSFEAQAIAMELDDVDPPRPMTHDLIAEVLENLRAEIKRIVITDLKEGTFYAEIVIQQPGTEKEISIDARPSDSIAIALRVGAKIYVEDEVMDEASIPAQLEEPDEENEESKRLKILHHRLKRAVEEEEFEEAAELRDEIRELQKEVSGPREFEAD
ncbi:MAG: bifunctional nuclease family protein [bacterium]